MRIVGGNEKKERKREEGDSNEVISNREDKFK